MNEVEVLRSGLTGMHGMLDKAVLEMTLEQWNYCPEQGVVSAFFSFWHYVRTEDNITQFVIQGKSTSWLDGGFDEEFGLHRTAQGTGMTPEQAQTVKMTDSARWLEYQQSVWGRTDQYLENLDVDSLHTTEVTIKPVPPMSLWQGLFGMCLTHGYRHVGEIEHARGLVGLGGLAI